MKPSLLAVLPDCPWPPTAGNRVRNLAILRALASEFRVTILYLAHREPEALAPAELREVGRVVPLLAPHRLSRAAWAARHVRARLRRMDGLSPTAYFQSPPELGRMVSALLRHSRFDIVHVAYWYTLRHLPPFPRPPLWCLDTHDVFFERETLLYGRPPPRARAEEERLLRAYDVVVAITERDAQVLRPLLKPGALLAEIGMGVDVPRWSGAAPEASLGGRDRDWIAFYGALDTPSNLVAVRELVHEVFPRVRRGHPRAGLLLLGSSPRPEIAAMATEVVVVPGTVPDPAPYLAAARVLALPLRICSGFRSRAVEAMAAGLPIVAYPEAMEGLRVSEGAHWVAASGVGEMVERLVELLADPHRRRILGAAAQAEVARRYTLEATYGRFPGLYHEALEGIRSIPGDSPGCRPNPGSG